MAVKTLAHSATQWEWQDGNNVWRPYGRMENRVIEVLEWNYNHQRIRGFAIEYPLSTNSSLFRTHTRPMKKSAVSM